MVEAAVADYRPESIVLLAALVSVPAGEEDPGKNFKLNVLATQMVAEAARKHGVKRTVFASSAAVYGDSTAFPLEETGATIPISQYSAANTRTGASPAIDLGDYCVDDVQLTAIRQPILPVRFVK